MGSRDLLIMNLGSMRPTSRYLGLLSSSDMDSHASAPAPFASWSVSKHSAFSTPSTLPMTMPQE